MPDESPQNSRHPDNDPAKERSRKIWAEVRRMEQEREAEKNAAAKVARVELEESQRVAALVKEASDWRDAVAVSNFVALAGVLRGEEWSSWAEAVAARLSGGIPRGVEKPRAHMPTMREPDDPRWQEFLSDEEKKALTGFTRVTEQERWMLAHGVPYKRDGKRLVASRFHARAWLEGEEVPACGERPL